MVKKMELTKVEKRILDKIKEKRTLIDENAVIKIIKLANVQGDGYKRVSKMEQPDVTYLVPIEDIFLEGLNGCDLGTKYTLTEGSKDA